jgi:hypothetical protein
LTVFINITTTIQESYLRKICRNSKNFFQIIIAFHSFYLKNFIAYNSCTGEYIVIFTFVFTIYLSYSIVLSLAILTWLKFYFHMVTKYIYCVCPHSPFLMPMYLPLVPTPGKDLFYPPVFHFSMHILTVQGDFTLVLQACICCALAIALPPLLTHFLSPCSPNTQQFTGPWIMFYSYVDGLFQYFSFSNNFLSPTSHSPLRQTH